MQKKQTRTEETIQDRYAGHQIQAIMCLVLLSLVYVLSIQVPVLMAADNRAETEAARVVVIDPGHGGNDPGKVAVDKTPEKDINLAIALRLKEILENNGITVVMTRTEDTALYTEQDLNKKTADLKARCKLIAESLPDVVVSMHQNSYPSESVKGAQVFYYEKSEGGKKLAEKIQQCLIEQVDPNNKRKAKNNQNYYMLLHTECPAVIVECGFLSNWEETAKLKSEEYQIQVANAIKDGILSYLAGNKD